MNSLIPKSKKPAVKVTNYSLASIIASKVAHSSEMALRESEIRYRRLFESAQDGILILDAGSGVVIDVNPFLIRMLGFSKAEICGKELWELGFFKDIRANKAKFKELQQEKSIRYDDLPMETADGRKFRVEFVSNVYQEGNHQVIQCNIRNITERKQSEGTLQKSEKRFRAIVENSLEEISLVDSQGTLTWESPSTRRPLGYAPDSFMGKNLEDLIHPDDLPAASRLFEQIQELPGSIREGVFRVRHQDGSWRWMEAVLTNLLYEPAVQSVVINYRDITERKKAEEALRLSEDKYRTLVDEVNDGFYMADASGVFTFVNPALVRIYGVESPQALLGHKFMDFIAPEALAEISASIRASMPVSPAPETITGQIVRQDGTRAYIEVKSVSIIEDGQIVGSRGVVRDINERKRAEKELLFRNAILTTTQEASQDGLLVVDEEAHIITYNHRFIELMGIPAGLIDQKADQPVLEFVANSMVDPPAFVERVRSLHENKWETAQEEIQLKNGRILDRYSTPMIGQDHVYYGRIWYFNDITDRKRHEEEIHSRNAELTSLYQFSRLLADADNLRTVIDLVNRQTVESVHTTFASLALLEESDLVPQAVYPIRELGQEFRIGDRQPLVSLPVCQKVLETNEPFVMPADSPQVGNLERRLLLMDFAQSVCLVPLRLGGAEQSSDPELIGLLIMGEARADKREPFTTEKLQLARSIGDQAAAAIRRLRLREQSTRRLQQLASLSEIDRTIASILDLRISLQTILRHVCEQLEVDAAGVLVFNETLQALEYTAGRGLHSQSVLGTRQRLGEGQAGRAALERQMIQIPDVAASREVFARQNFMKVEQVAAYFAVPLITKGKLKGVLEVLHRTPLTPNEEWLDFFNTLAGQAAIAIDNVQMFESLQRSTDELELAYDATIEGWSHALDMRDKETEGHTRRVTEQTVRLASLFAISQKDLVQVRWGALLHDIGKMGVPDSILLKPGPLTEEEWVVMKKHPSLAYELLAPIGFLRRALDIPYCHHEKWDGSGYPRGLKGEQIPLVARIFAVVDVWDAITSDRPYRQAWSQEKARQHIRAGAGSHFDPSVLEKFFQELG